MRKHLRSLVKLAKLANRLVLCVTLAIEASQANWKKIEWISILYMTYASIPKKPDFCR